MKLISHIVLAVTSVLIATPAFAGSDAGEDSARHYKSHPEKYDGEKIDMDCAFVTRVNGGPQVEGVVFFIAHTVDDENKVRGGAMVVAVLDDDADSFMRKYGTAIQRRSGAGDWVETTRLRGTFHQLDRGRVYLDESGEAHAILEEHRGKHGDVPLPNADGHRGKGKKF